jgi:hypothetical protein
MTKEGRPCKVVVGAKYGRTEVVAVGPERDADNRTIITIKCECGNLEQTNTKALANTFKCKQCPRKYKTNYPARPASKQTLSHRKCNVCKLHLPKSRYFNHAECLKNLDYYDIFEDHQLHWSK